MTVTKKGPAEAGPFSDCLNTVGARRDSNP